MTTSNILMTGMSGKQSNIIYTNEYRSLKYGNSLNIVLFSPDRLRESLLFLNKCFSSCCFYQIDAVNRPSWQAMIKGKKTWNIEPIAECVLECKRRLSITMEPGDICKYSFIRNFERNTT